MPNFKSVEVVRLQSAFALAHRESENPALSREVRNKFRAIARMIWDACGEEKSPPIKAGHNLCKRPEVAITIQEASER